MKNKLKLRWLKTILLIFFMGINLSFAQDLTIFVKKGALIVSSDKTITVGEIAKLKSVDFVELKNSSLAIIKLGSQIAELKSKKIYTHKELLQLFSPKKSYTKSFFEVIFNSQLNGKSASGITTRGILDNPFAYQPKDDFIILSDSLILTASFNDAKLQSDIKLYGIGMRDTVFLPKNKIKNKIKIKTPVSGTYYWEYEIAHKSITAKAKNVFIVPEETKKLQLLQDFNEFKNQLKGFSKEMEVLLVDEYCILNKIIF